MLRNVRAWFTRVGQDINRTPWKLRTARTGFIALYIATGIAGYQYLQDTRYRATGEPSPYKPRVAAPEPNEKGGIVAPHDTSPVYDGLAKEYDSKINLEEITSYIWWMRRRVAQQVTGNALEVACGTGRNICWLKPAQVASLTLVDASLPMLEVARSKFDSKYAKKYDHKPVQFVQGRAEDLVDLAKSSGQKFDTVYETFGLCSHEDPNRALREMSDLVAPGGKIVLLEHGRGTYDSMNRRMDARAEQRSEEWGCRWNLDIDAIVRESGLTIIDQDRYHFGTIYFYILEPGSTRVSSSTK